MSQLKSPDKPGPNPIDDDFRRLITYGVSVVVGTHDDNLVPEICRAWGPDIQADDSIELFLDKLPAAQTLENLKQNGLIAVTFTRPATHGSIQLKGRCRDIRPRGPRPDETERIARHREAFVQEVLAYGIPEHVTRGEWTSEVVWMSFVAEEAFDQTPGPVAGRPR
jgi:hypothetical protein